MVCEYRKASDRDVSVYAHDPEAAASAMAGLIGGQIAPFPPHEGAWVCFLSGDRMGWELEFIDIYPRSIRLAAIAYNARPRFVGVKGAWQMEHDHT